MAWGAVGAGGLKELTLTTNGSQLARIRRAARRRGATDQRLARHAAIPRNFAAITRWGDLAKVLAGIDAAQGAGLAVKINMVALKGVNETKSRQCSNGPMDAAWT